MLSPADLPQYQLGEMVPAEIHRWSWCGETIANPYSRGMEAVLEARVHRRLDEGLYSYRSPRLARTWFKEQRRLSGSCTRFAVGQQRYSHIRSVKPPTLRGARQVHAQRYTFHVPDSGWRVHVMRISIRRAAWTQSVTLTEPQPPSRARAVKVARVAYRKAVANLVP